MNLMMNDPRQKEKPASIEIRKAMGHYRNKTTLNVVVVEVMRSQEVRGRSDTKRKKGTRQP
jgi:hypothetical protein